MQRQLKGKRGTTIDLEEDNQKRCGEDREHKVQDRNQQRKFVAQCAVEMN